MPVHLCKLQYKSINQNNSSLYSYRYHIIKEFETLNNIPLIGFFCFFLINSVNVIRYNQLDVVNFTEKIFSHGFVLFYFIVLVSFMLLVGQFEIRIYILKLLWSLIKHFHFHSAC